MEEIPFCQELHQSRSQAHQPHQNLWSDEVDWTDGDEHGIERFWRNIIAGAASCRFHRPPSGIGLNQRAQAHIRSMSMLLNELNVFQCTPDVKHTLLSERTEDEAYLTYKAGEQYAIYFPDGGEIMLDLTATDSTFSLKWLDIEKSRWDNKVEVSGGKKIALHTPEKGNWLVLLTRR